MYDNYSRLYVIDIIYYGTVRRPFHQFTGIQVIEIVHTGQGVLLI